MHLNNIIAKFSKFEFVVDIRYEIVPNRLVHGMVKFKLYESLLNFVSNDNHDK